jgi:glycosyltransferase involved in cell wall biosynthesis
MATEFIMPINYFPFSVNTDKFKPDENIVEKEYDCIVYIKRRSTKLINNILDILKNMNIKYKIFKYGTYKEEEYKNILLQSKFMVVLDAHESQGFALEEAMSCNVPLLVIDATSMYDETNDGINSTYGYLKPKKLLATSVPYWSNECGIKITHESEFKSELDNMLKKYNTFTPREYILKTLSDKVCMKRILEYFKL